jgi:hypothetical protein
MSALIHQQQTLLQALWAPSASDTAALHAVLCTPWQRGLQAYQVNASALATRALQAAYPVLAALVGADCFAALACDFRLHHPPEQGDLACWGAALPRFVAHNPQLADVPYLADVALVEWALHTAASAPDAQAQPASFALLTQLDPAAVTLTLPPGTAVYASPWPVVSLIGTHLHNDPPWEHVATQLHQHHGEVALVTRQGLRACVLPCTTAEAALLTALLGGQSLLAALNAALSTSSPPTTPQSVAWDFAAWLNTAVTQGLVLGAAPLAV